MEKKYKSLDISKWLFKINVTLLLIFGGAFSMMAQRTIMGKVTDVETREGLIQASVQIEGTNIGVITDAEGNYEINVPEGVTALVFSYVGYRSQTIIINNENTINVALEPGFGDFIEVVVTALGRKEDARNLGYAAQTLDNKTIAEVQSSNFVDNLAGKVAGVTVTGGATGPGSTTKITIRGESSFTNNNPLFIVDGTPINNNSIVNDVTEAAAGFQEVDFGNGAMEIDASNIANVSVLKGPSATALYGTRAANGVIIITTKDGSEYNNRTSIDMSSAIFMENAFQLPQFQNLYGQGNSGQFEYVNGLGGGINDNISYSYGPAFSDNLNIPQYDSPVTLADGSVVRGGDIAVHGGRPITPTPFVAYPDNLKNFYQTGYTFINNVAVSSGNTNGSYRLSFTDLRNESIIPGVNLDRKTLGGRFKFKPTNQLTINSTIQYTNAQSDNRPSHGYGSENVGYGLVAWGPRSLNIAAMEDYWQPGLEGIAHYSFNYTYFDNPYFILFENTNAFNRDRILGNISAQYRFTDELSLTVRTGMDYSNELRTLRRAYSTNRFKTGGYAEQDVFYRENNTDFLLNYNKNVGSISLDVSAGANRLDQRASTSLTQAMALAQPGIYSLTNSAVPLEIFQNAFQKRINSVYGIAKIGYEGFLFLEITGRNDWSSALANQNGNNTSFFYPSVSASYILTKTMDLPDFVTFAKLRASWAQVGNDTDPYQTSVAFCAQMPFQSQPTFSSSDLIANANLLPERVSSYEFGADLRFFDNKVRLDLTYYNAITQNQIIALPVALSSGYNQQVVNGGAVRTAGWEAILGWTPVQTRDFRWDFLANFTRSVATVENLPAGADKITLAYSRVYNSVSQTVWFQVEEGGRIGDMYGTGYARNENGDFIIENGRYVVDNTLKKLGNYNPDFMVGFTNNLSYKNFNLNFVIDWRQGGELVSRTLALAGVAGQLIETENRPEEGIVAEGVVNTGTSDNPIWEANMTPISAESYYRQFYDRNHEENNTYSATYLKLRQFSLGYTFNSTEKGLLGDGRTLRVSFIGRNLLAFSEIPHFDPEQISIQGNDFVSGVEDISYPTARSFGFKVDYHF